MHNNFPKDADGKTIYEMVCRLCGIKYTLPYYWSAPMPCKECAIKLESERLKRLKISNTI